jgi:hypothetical protein
LLTLPWHLTNDIFQANNALVWRETVRVVHEWFDEIDGLAEVDENVNLTEAFTHVGEGSIPNEDVV